MDTSDADQFSHLIWLLRRMCNRSARQQLIVGRGQIQIVFIQIQTQIQTQTQTQIQIQTQSQIQTQVRCEPTC